MANIPLRLSLAFRHGRKSVPQPTQMKYHPSLRNRITDIHHAVTSGARASSYRFSSKVANPSDNQEDLGTLIFTPTPAVDNPGDRVQGLTEKDLENPDIAAFFAANFPPEAEKPFYIKESKPKGKLELLNIRQMHCYRRDFDKEEGSKRSRQLRDVGFIPGVLYGHDPNLGIDLYDTDSRILIKTPDSVIRGERDRYHHHFESRVYDLTLFDGPEDEEGTKHRVMPRDLSVHPVKHNKPYCLNFMRYWPGRPIRIPIAYINEEESPALKRGGFIVPVNRYLECVVEDGVPIPEQLDLECAGIKHKEVLRMERIILPDGVKVSDNVDPEKFLYGSVYGKYMADDESGEGKADADEDEEE